MRKNSNNNNKKVLVAMSGGVDSSVAAALLKDQGFDIIGATMQVWPSKKDFGGCCSLEAVNDAKRVADRLKIPHYTLNFRKEFQDKVINNFVEEYKNGRTPNPCVRCNQFIKFDFLMRKAKEFGCDYLATGHYARIQPPTPFSASPLLRGKGIGDGGNYRLLKGLDKRKDQAYVLYMMDQESLAHTLYPLGDFTKEEVRKIAKDLDLPVHDKEESQEICFVEDKDYGRFLKEINPEAVKPGPILDRLGNILGMHGGIAFYTLGQRKGIGAHQGLPKYVVEIDQKNNAIVIGDDEDTFGSELIADQVCFVSEKSPEKPLDIKAKIRYNSPETDAVLYPLGKEKDKDKPLDVARGKEQDKGEKAEEKVKVIFKEAQRSITPGQSVVFYKGEEVIGGGIIQ
jgi:tRNA-specific 2-thiouridylase